MAIITSDQITLRMVDVIVAKYPTHSLEVAADVLPLNDVKYGPIQKMVGSVSLGVYYERQTGTDEPQDTGENRLEFYTVEALTKFPSFSRKHAQQATRIKDALMITLKREKELLDPTSGLKLQWLFQIWPGEGRADWLHTKGRLTGYVQITIGVTAWIYEAETY